MNKGRTFRTSARIPFILRYHGKVLEVMQINSALTSVDFAPSILSLMGVENHGGAAFDRIDFSSEILSQVCSTDYNRTRFLFIPKWAAVLELERKRSTSYNPCCLSSLKVSYASFILRNTCTALSFL